MNIEELEKEAEEKAKKRVKGFKCQDNCEKSYIMGALDFAEPREKRITELEEQIEKVKHYLDYDIPLDLINGATIMICRMLKLGE